MDDLSGMDWTDSKKTTGTETQHPPRMNPTSYYPSLRPTPPISGRSSPLPPQLSNKSSSAAAFTAKGATPSNDSFANLVPFRAPQLDRTLSLQEQQKSLQEKKRVEQERSQNKGHGINLGNQDGEFWDSLGDGTARQDEKNAPPSYAGTDEYGGPKLSKAINKPFVGVEEASRKSRKGASRNRSVDLLLDFDSSSPREAQVKSDEVLLHTGTVSGHVVKHQSLAQSPSPLNGPATNGHVRNGVKNNSFGFGGVGGSSTGQGPAITSSADDDDILGLLGRPVSEFSQAEKKEQAIPEYSKFASPDPTDRALAELIEMGFSPEKSKEALQSTDSGKDVQGAVGWLLNQAHAESRKKSKSNDPEHTPSSRQRPPELRRSSSGSQTPSNDAPLPAWMREKSRSHQERRRDDSKSPVYGERDPGKYAADLGNNLFKTANSLWKTGTQKITKAVSELNSDSDSSQPRWMREAQDDAGTRNPRATEHIHRNIERPGRSLRQPSKDEGSTVTDEALLLESGDSRPPPRKPFRQDKTVLPTRSLDSSRDHSPAITQPQHQPQPQKRETHPPRFVPQPPFKDMKFKLSRQATEEQSSNVYMSPARRKRPARHPSPEPELLFDATQSVSQPAHPLSHIKASAPTKTHSPIQIPITAQVKPQTRSVPSISPAALRSSTKNRQEGSSAFKRGDFALATTHYSAALSALPPAHPLAIVLFTNRAIAHLKTGDPKSCITDAKSALALIGPSQGALEQIDLGDEGLKEMKMFWAKAMARQAEALEQLERWSDAASVWKSCIEAGAGDAVSIAGRNRCEKAAAGPSQATQVRKPTVPRRSEPPKPVPTISALDALSGYSTPRDLSGDNAFSGEAVERLRLANLEAERVDDEKFALSDQVSERLARWRAGKESNLRALLASLDTVLWEGVGWKKVSMGELIVPGKVKVVYMKGIAKVHPDKVCDRDWFVCFFVNFWEGFEWSFERTV